MLRRTLLGLAVAVLTLAVPATAHGITNGEPDFEHTYTGAIVAVAPEWGVTEPIAWCSGTLVAPTVFVTAAHCLVDQGPELTYLGVTFDQNLSDGVDGLTAIDAMFPSDAFVDAANAGVFALEADFGVVTLAQPVTDVGYASLPTLGQFDGLKPGPRSSFMRVGYGIQVFKGSQLVDISARYSAPGQLIKTFYVGDGSAWALTGAKGTGGGTCFGDSGGSTLWRDTDLLVAVHSSGFNQCVGHGFEARLDTPLAQEFLARFL